jgi:hypothetical protein
MNSRRTFRSTTIQTALALLVAATACEDREATQVVVSMATDLMAGNPLSRLSMTVERYDDEQQVYIAVDPDVTKEWEIAAPPLGFELPGTVVTYSGAEKEPKIRVTLIAQDPMGDRMLRRQSVFRLVKEKTLYMRMAITAKCFDDADCPMEKTCIEGRCRDPNFEKLPEYRPATRPELTAECNSGTLFRNTTTGAELQRVADACPGDQLCIEGACYPGDVFGMPLPASQPLTVNLQISDGNGAPVNGADVRVEDGPVSLVRRLRRANVSAPPPAMNVTMTGQGLYQVQTRSDPLTTDIELTVTAANFAPQVVTVPIKPGVGVYQVPAVLSPLGETMLAAGVTQDLMPPGGGRPTTLRVTAASPMTVRYALLDGRYLPGQALRAGAGGELLQAAAVLYLENVGVGSFPLNTQVALGNASTPPVFGAEGGAAAYLLDLQGQWKQPGAEGGSFQDTANPRLLPRSGGFWAIANWTPRPACVSGRVLKPGGGACAGARLRLLGPDGVTAADSTGSDGSFCASAAQQEAAILAVGGTTRTIYVPAAPVAGAQCSLTDACAATGDITLDSADDCDRPPVLVSGRRQSGEACTRTLECAGLASCHRGFCVGESFARVSMSWTVSADFDLHVRRVSTGQEVSHRMPEIKGVGGLNVQQCTESCTGTAHLENILLSGTPGSYEAWVENFNGAAAGEATIEVFVGGKQRETMPATVSVPGAAMGRSPVVTFTLP